MKTNKILLVADVLFSKRSRPEQERWFPPQLRLIEKLGRFLKGKLGRFLKLDWRQERMLAWFDRKTQQAFRKMVEKASELGPYDGVIGAGNYTIGTNESGMISEECIEQWKCFIGMINTYFQCILFWAIGGHDVGYRYHVKKRVGFGIGSETGGMSFESVSAVRRHIGPLFQSQVIGGATFVSISTNLVKNVNKDSHEHLQELQQQQSDFIKDILEGTPEKIFLVMHDVTALSAEVRKLLIKNRHKIHAIIHGHNHSWLFRWFTMLTYPPYLYLSLRIPMILADAPWGSFGIGKAFKVLEVQENGSWRVKRHAL